jgi:membrane-associated protein
LLFTAGFLASQAVFDVEGYPGIVLLAVGCFIAAVAGDSVGYSFGYRVGPRLFNREDSVLFHRKHLLRAQKFYERHGGKTIVLARFLPAVRTFAPIVAGAAEMPYPRFLFFNVTGGALWALGLTTAGYFLGSLIPDPDRYLLPIVFVIIVASAMPTVLHVLRDEEQRASLLLALQELRKRLARRR